MFVTLTENKTLSTAHTVHYSASTRERVTTKELSCVTVNMDTLNQILQNHQGTTNLIQPHIMRQPHITPQHIMPQHLIIPLPQHLLMASPLPMTRPPNPTLSNTVLPTITPAPTSTPRRLLMARL